VCTELLATQHELLSLRSSREQADRLSPKSALNLGLGRPTTSIASANCSSPVSQAIGGVTRTLTCPVVHLAWDRRDHRQSAARLPARVGWSARGWLRGSPRDSPRVHDPAELPHADETPHLLLVDLWFGYCPDRGRSQRLRTSRPEGPTKLMAPSSASHQPKARPVYWRRDRNGGRGRLRLAMVDGHVQPVSLGQVRWAGAGLTPDGDRFCISGERRDKHSGSSSSCPAGQGAADE